MRVSPHGSVLFLAILFASVPAAAQEHAWVDIPGVRGVLGIGTSMNFGGVAGDGQVPLSDGRLLAAGGLNENRRDAVAASAVFNGLNGWAPTGSMTTPRMRHAMVRLLDGRVMAIGGIGSLEIDPSQCYGLPGTECNYPQFSSVEFYDPQTGVWTAGAHPMSQRRISPRAVVLGDGRVLVVGGFRWDWRPICTGCPIGQLVFADSRATELYDPATDSWTALQDSPIPFERENQEHWQLFALGNGRAILESAGALYLIDTATGIFGPTPAPAFGSGVLASLQDGRLLSAGGRSNPSSAAWILDPVSLTWSAAAPPPFSVMWPMFLGFPPLPSPATTLADGTVLVHSQGGSSTLIYRPATDSWTSGPDAMRRDGSSLDLQFVVGLANGRLFVGKPRDSGGEYLMAGALYRELTPPTAAAISQVVSGLPGGLGAYPMDATPSSDADTDSLVQFTWSEGATTLTTATTPTALVPLAVGAHTLTLVVTDQTGQTGSTTVTVTVEDALAPLTLQLAAANASNAALTSANAELSSQVTSLQTQLGAANATIFGVNTHLKTLETMLANAFKNPAFTLPGASTLAKVQNVVTAIGGLNKGALQSIYKGLGGQ